MKSYRKELWFNLPTRRGFVNIIPEVELALRESGIQEGLALVNHDHITVSTNLTAVNNDSRVGYSLAS